MHCEFNPVCWSNPACSIQFVHPTVYVLLPLSPSCNAPLKRACIRQHMQSVASALNHLQMHSGQSSHAFIHSLTSLPIHSPIHPLTRPPSRNSISVSDFPPLVKVDPQNSLGRLACFHRDVWGDGCATGRHAIAPLAKRLGPRPQRSEVSAWAEGVCSVPCGGGGRRELTRTVISPPVRGAGCPPLKLMQETAVAAGSGVGAGRRGACEPACPGGRAPPVRASRVAQCVAG